MQRDPLPHIMPSLPSALKMRMRQSATSEGSIRISPSLPMPVWKRLTTRDSSAGFSGGGGLHGVDEDIIVSDAVHFHKFHSDTSKSEG